MSSLSSTVGCSDDKFSTSAKYPLKKVNEGGLNSAAILLLTVQYSQNDKALQCSTKSVEEHTSEDVDMDRSESLPYSLLHLGDSIVKDISYNDVSGTIDLENNKTNTNYNPVIVLRNEDGENDSDDTFHKESYSESMLNNFLFTPLPKSVVCTVMSKDNKEKKSSGAQEVISKNPSLENSEINNAERFSDCDGYTSGEETVHVISDKPVMCRALASLPVNFLYFGKTASKTESSKGVFAKREISRKAQFGPMEGVLCDFNPRLKYHHLQLTIENNGHLERLDVSNENTSNWMRYVRHAESPDEQNLSLNQIGKNLYFTAIRKIVPGEELKAWYSTAYAKSRNLPSLGNEITLYRHESSKLDSFHENEVVYEPENFDIKEPSRKWTCSHCQRIFRSPALFNLHVLTHAADNLETNENCDKLPSISSKDKSITGSSKLRNKKHFVCNQCSKVFSNNATLSSHLRSHASEKVFDCPICKQTFYKVRYLKQHIGSHSVGGIFFCPHCNKEYQEYKHIRNHIRRFHSGKRFNCIKCSKQFSTLDKLKIHLLSHSNARDFTCSKCGKQFKRKDKLTAHTRRKHQLCSEKQPSVNPSRKKTPANYDEYVYKCHICSLGFKRRGMLVNHLAKKHPSLTPSSVPELNLPILKANVDYYCQYCDKIYKSSSKRKAHILKNHPGEKLPLSRQLSSKESSSKNETYSQTIGSVTTNPHSCEWCHKQYASRSKLLGHQRKKHPNLLPKDFLHPKPSGKSNPDTEVKETAKEVDEKVTDTEMFLHDPLELSEYEFSVGESKLFGDGEFIVDANTLKRVLKGDILSTDCSPETLAELGQIIESRPEGYFKVFQGPTGMTLAHPIEVWDPLSICLSPPETSNILPST